MHVICEWPASELLQCEVLAWDDTTGQSNLQQFLLFILCWRQVFALGLVGWRALGKENEYFTKLDYWLLIWCVWWTQVSVGNFQDKRYCMHEVHSTLYILWVIARVTENRRLETIVRTQTNATKTYLHEGRMLRHYSSMVSLRAAVTTKGRHQQTSSLRQHQR